MPTEEQIERAARAWWNHDSAADMYGHLSADTQESVCANARAALAAARPTPEEHERGVEAAMKWMEGIALGTPEQFVRGVIAAYLAATGGGNG